MSNPLTIDDALRPGGPSGSEARQSLNAHVAAKAAELRAKHGPRIGWSELLKILEDRSCVRYACEVVFDAAPLLPGEVAFPRCKGERPEDGFTIHVHPFFATDLARVPYLVLYQLVVVNYGDFASPDDAETFGATALGLAKDDYYQALCAMADAVGLRPGAASGPEGSVPSA